MCLTIQLSPVRLNRSNVICKRNTTLRLKVVTGGLRYYRGSEIQRKKEVENVIYYYTNPASKILIITHPVRESGRGEVIQ